MGRIRTASITAATALAFALALTACATTGGAAEQETVVGIEVENTLPAGGSLTIWIVPELDPRTLLGTVAPGETATFDYTTRAAGRYVLVARTTGGSEIVSRRFAIPGEATVSWNLNTNTVHVR